jgi:hypothetical protein
MAAFSACVRPWSRRCPRALRLVRSLSLAALFSPLLTSASRRLRYLRTNGRRRKTILPRASWRCCVRYDRNTRLSRIFSPRPCLWRRSHPTRSIGIVSVWRKRLMHAGRRSPSTGDSLRPEESPVSFNLDAPAHERTYWENLPLQAMRRRGNRNGSGFLVSAPPGPMNALP